MSKGGEVDQFMREIPVHSSPRRLVDWNQRKNLEMAWETVKANRGRGGVDGQSLAGFAAQLDRQLDRLHRELKEDVYRAQPVRQVQIPKAGKPGEEDLEGGARSGSHPGHDNNGRQPGGAGGRSGEAAAIPRTERRCRLTADLWTESNVRETDGSSGGRREQPASLKGGKTQ